MEAANKFLKMMLDGYRNNMQGITQYIDSTSEQLEEAKKQRDEMEESITELKDLLGVTDEELEEEEEGSEE
jgi:peptidoglycan hydrolase CwlO-like protein